MLLGFGVKLRNALQPKRWATVLPTLYSDVQGRTGGRSCLEGRFAARNSGEDLSEALGVFIIKQVWSCCVLHLWFILVYGEPKPCTQDGTGGVADPTVTPCLRCSARHGDMVCSSPPRFQARACFAIPARSSRPSGKSHPALESDSVQL